MPLYDFICKNPDCLNYNKIITELLGTNEYEQLKDSLKCPACSQPMKRLWNGHVGHRFKGTGFHATDYGKK